jgi:hypothetical protein
MTDLSRRRVLRGILNGGTVTVALPLLDRFLNDNGTALASGRPMPVRFGTWFWGLGMTKSVFVPKKLGKGFDLPEEIESLAKIRDHINLFTNFTAFRDTYENICHYTGWVISRTGQAPRNFDDRPGETIDVTISNKIGGTTRFKTLTATATGDVRNSFSYENANSPNAPEFAPINFYTRLFGPDFQDPNAPTFTPSPTVMVRKGVLSGAMDEIHALNRRVGKGDQARLDQYFTGLRQIEHQLDQQLTKPEPIAACRPGPALKEEPKPGNDTELIGLRHKMMTDLMVMAVACDQTRVFNMAYSTASASTIKAGYDKPHHTTTHEERVDEAVGYQPTASWFTRRSMESWAYFVQAFADMKEGDGSLLDNVLIYANTDHGYARVHTLDGMPMFTAGRAGGRIKSGLHIDGNGTAATRLGYTAMRLMGVDAASWGTKSNTTSQDIGEMLA